MKKSKIAANVVSYTILILMLIVTAFPIVYTVAASFKTNMEIMTRPEKLLPIDPTGSNYVNAWTSPNFNVGRLLWNSTYYTLLNVAISVVIALLGGYVFSRGHFPFKKTIFSCFTALMFIQTGGIGIYATFQVLNLLNIKQGLGALLLIKLFAVPIVNVYLVRGYINTIPKELDEAAKIDGCGFFGIFVRIITPVVKPILATIAILTFNASWNDFIMPNIFTLTRPEQRTLIVGLFALKSTDGAATSWNLMLSGATLALVPVLVAYTMANRYFIQGLTEGAVKG